MEDLDEFSKQVRVDNWGIFFLQRLQVFFNKTDYCDLTLQFDGNVQLKVHRLVLNACTEYFLTLEQTSKIVDNILIMPSDLQADVVLPIVNFMYTGMLQFHNTVFEKLYQTASIMNITVLTKLLDAQRMTDISLMEPFKKSPPPRVVWNSQNKLISPKNDTELPPPLPGRKLPVWKRKNVPAPQNSVKNYFTEQRRQAISIDPLASVDTTPKPTRFEWPEEELPAFSMFDTDFDDISYTSKPLLTQNDEPRPSTSYEQNKVKSDLEEDEEMLGIQDTVIKDGSKRKGDFEVTSAKRTKLTVNEKENNVKQVSKINITSTGKISAQTEVDHAKIISEVLKKYPNLVKKNKNIRLKILAKSNSSPVTAKKVSERNRSQDTEDSLVNEEKDETGPWQCQQCSTPTESVEFVLYYLYRKHMTDVHCEKFDSRQCKFCSHKSTKHNVLMHHQYVKHGIKPPLAYNFPKCTKCPYIALNEPSLTIHKTKHDRFDFPCTDCNISFTSQPALIIHMQKTGHTGKSEISYDCQYCTKKCHSSSILIEHIKQHHLDEPSKAPTSSIEEDEYPSSESISDNRKDKIKIISDVKLPIMDIPQQSVTLEPSSEAEALNNVATGIATSLGLVDVVVLDDNQQYILHTDNQQSISSGESEYILPDIPDNQTFTNEITTGENITMLHNSDISSTDELVMVLTDQDYGNENNEMLEGDHSNIVVLYSHPVDCQDNQFITSSGNLVLTSQSGLIELQNTNTIVTSNSNFISTPSVTSETTQIESIELIQKELNGQPDLSKSEVIDTPVAQLQDSETVVETDESNIISKEDNSQKQDGSSLQKKDDTEKVIDENLEADLEETANKEESSTNIQITEPEHSNATETLSERLTQMVNVEICTEEVLEVQLDKLVQNQLEEPFDGIHTKSNILVELNKSTELSEKNEDQDTSATVEAPQSYEELNQIESLNDASPQEEETTELNQEAADAEVLEANHLLDSLEEEPNNILDNTTESKSDVSTAEEDYLQESSLEQNTETIVQTEGMSVELEDSLESKEDTSKTQVTTLCVAPQTEGILLATDNVIALKEDATKERIESQLDMSQEITSEQETTCSNEQVNVLETSEPLQQLTEPSKQTARSKTKHRKSLKKSKPTNRKADTTLKSSSIESAKIILDDWEDTASPPTDMKHITNVHKLIDDWDDEEDDGKKPGG